MICHVLIIEIKFCQTSLEEMLVREPLASLPTFFRASLIKFYKNSQRMSDCFYHVTESKKLN